MSLFSKSSLLAASAAVLLSTCVTSQASADFGGGLGFLPYGFYQPYGARYSTSLRTPPYFSLNPPVYYGARHARPYGLSPFAAPPQVSAGSNYRTRLRSDFLEPVVPTPGPMLSNPCIHTSASVSTQPRKGAIQSNPFVTDVPDQRIAKK